MDYVSVHLQTCKEAIMKTCKTCGVEKDLTEFSTNGKSRKGTITYSAHCKSCRALSARTERSESQKTMSCACCGSVFKFVNKCNRTEDYCGSCYPMYRQAYKMFHNIQHRSKTKDMPFDLTLDFILGELKKGQCPRTGIKFTFTDNGRNMGARKASTPSIDKIDPKKGYVKDNVQIVCWWYNLSKSTFTDNEVIELCKRVVKQQCSLSI
jgi:hypothetical protein